MMRNDTQSNEASVADGPHYSPQLIAALTVSIACTAAAIVTGSYAFSMLRRRIADTALMSVHDLLETCRERVADMERELETVTLSMRGETVH